ncbi:MAG: glycoside hydrolase family 9 protein [Opitutaceae bacterium]|nr:glycoside hydrolase family 9 protein [Cytophagales bacterium]
MKKIYLTILTIFSLSALDLCAQGFSIPDYKKALWMTTRMYGGQRSGTNNWLVYNHLPNGVSSNLTGISFAGDKDGAVDLSGGWHDCADHVKFGQTQFYSAYVLLKSYAEISNGYSDYYAYDYKGYKNANKWNWEDNAHAPNGIPDILDEVKHATDFFIKCTPNSSTFYYQIGQGGPDHMQWVTSVKMQTNAVSAGGEPRVVYKNPADASMPGFCGATLALMARLYSKYDPTYAATCLTHATYAYDYAKAHPGTVGSPDGGFYGANTHWEDEYVDLCTELFFATNNTSYKTEAISFANNTNKDPNIYYSFDYTNNGELAWYNLALLGQTAFKTKFIDHVNADFIGKVDGNGIYTGGGNWGTLRYVANAAWMAGLSAKLGNTNSNLNKFVYTNIDYIMGKNAQNQSFIVGFGAKNPLHPHHRNVYLSDANVGDAGQQTLTIPAKNQQFGYMVGGVRSGAYADQITNYQTSEGGIDYNAGLVGALAYINSVLAPVVNGLAEDLYGNNSISVFPNPSSDGFNLQSTADYTVRIHNELGKTLQEFNSSRVHSFGNNLQPGLYHVVFSQGGKNIKTINVLKQ